MKLIIDIADDQYKAVQDGMWCGSLYEELKNGIPVEQSGDLISREEMWKAYHKMIDCENTIYVFNAIKNLPSVTLQPCEDCISRKAVNELVDELARAISDERSCISRGRSTATIMRDILHLPSITPHPKVGYWIEHIHNGIHYIECPKCSSWFLRMYLTRNSYCPNCGSKNGGTE